MTRPGCARRHAAQTRLASVSRLVVTDSSLTVIADRFRVGRRGVMMLCAQRAAQTRNVQHAAQTYDTLRRHATCLRRTVADTPRAAASFGPDMNHFLNSVTSVLCLHVETYALAQTRCADAQRVCAGTLQSVSGSVRAT
jgi:hypothetical protein